MKKKQDFSFQNRKSEDSKEKFARPSIEGMRLNKYIAHCGVCSRRQAGDWVKAGKVKVNGEVLLEPWYQVQKEDQIEYEGQVLHPEERMVYILMNKPKNVITTVNDDRGRKTVLDIVRPHVAERVFPVGRLDWATLGLLLLTNDGSLSQKLAHPSNEVKKFYQVTLDKPMTAQDLEKIRAGLELEDGIATVDEVDYIMHSEQLEVGIGLHIGRNRIVRRIFEHLGYEVLRLDRTYYAGLTKKDLPRGHFRHLSKREIIMLRHFS